MDIKGFQVAKKILYSDTQIPDIFISQYIALMDSDHFKIYIYCLFLNGYQKKVDESIVASGLNMDIQKVKDAFSVFVKSGLATFEQGMLTFVDVKAREIERTFEVPDDASVTTSLSKDQEKVLRAINNEFFQGMMNLSWYVQITNWFERYGFETDVMYQLFNICYENDRLRSAYVSKVAEDWHSRNIRTDLDLHEHLKYREKITSLSKRIAKNLRMRNGLSVYEEKIVEKWHEKYGYDFDVIEMALSYTTQISQPNMKYFDAILTDWYQKKLKTPKQIQAYFQNNKKKRATNTSASDNTKQRKNFGQRKYDERFFENLYEEL